MEGKFEFLGDKVDRTKEDTEEHDVGWKRKESEKKNGKNFFSKVGYIGYK